MPIMKEAVSKDDFDRMEKGLRPLTVKKNPPPDPEKPKIEYEVTLEEMGDFLNENYTMKFIRAKKRLVKNEEGIRFVGFDVSIEYNPIVEKKGNETFFATRFEGWMMEGPFLEFVRKHRTEIDQKFISW